MKYFSYDPDGNGFELHKTGEGAKAAAKLGLDAAREEASEGWSDESMYICWGVVCQQVFETNSRLATEEDGIDTDIWSERNLVDLK